MRRLLALCALALLFAAAVPSSASAQVPQCQCFCASPGGAMDRGQATAADCASRCAPERVAVCASSKSQYPGNAPRCFTTDRCAAQGGDFDSYQPPECPQGQHYCFPKTNVPVPLSVSIGSIRTVSDYGQYIGAVYNFLLGAAITIAIVMMMVGGVQYVTSGATGEVGAAKDRIKNAVIGLVILFSAYVVLFTVNPNLVSLQPPRLPMVKTILSAGSDSCENFIKNGYAVDPASGTCGGAAASVTKGPDGAGVTEGTTCFYRSCAAGKACYGEGEEAVCLGCSEIVPQNTKGATPSSGLCRSLKLEDELTPAGNLRVGHYCFHTYDPSLLNFFGLGFAQGTTISANIGTCAEMTIDCRSIRTCDDYENVSVKAGSHQVVLDDLEPSGDINLGGDYDIKFVCELNPCRALGQSVDLQRGCVYNTYAGLADECEPR